MAGSLYLIIALIAVALLFDFLNGLHDAANSIATVVSTRVLSPGVAVVFAAFFNFIAFLFFGVHVAADNRHGADPSPEVVNWQVIFGALMGAISWNLITWWGRHSLVELARADRRAGRGGHRERGRGRGDRARASSRPRAPSSGRRCLASRSRSFCALVVAWIVAAQHALCGRSALPRAPARLSRALLHRPRRQRRAENHGHHRRPAIAPRAMLAQSARAVLGRAVSATRRWVWARCSAAGGS